MDLEVRKYKNKDEIIINCFDTWTNSLQNLIKENYDTIEKYRRKEKEIFELKEQCKRENKVYNIFDLRNEYYDTICDLKEKFHNILLKENKPLICFHASRYTDKEKDRIYKYGLKTSSKDNLLDRIQNLLNDGYIDEKESEFLKEHHLLIKQDNMRENQLWVTLGNVNISHSVDSYDGILRGYFFTSSSNCFSFNLIISISTPYKFVKISYLARTSSLKDFICLCINQIILPISDILTPFQRTRYS